jgi:hypothetical protein
MRSKQQRSAGVENVHTLVALLIESHRQSIQTFSPIVQDIIQSRCRDIQKIEHTLDLVFDCAGHPEGLLLYKALCRYYYGIDPQAAASYVYAYRDWYEPDDGRKFAGVSYGE